MALNSSAINKTASKSWSNLVDFVPKTDVFVPKTIQFDPKWPLFATRFRHSGMGGMARYDEVGREVWRPLKSFVIKYAGMTYGGGGGYCRES
jgi:hypothetical protein